MARAGLCDLAGFRRLHPDLADALAMRILTMEQEEAKAEGEVHAAAVKAVQATIISAATAIVKTVAARPGL